MQPEILVKPKGIKLIRLKGGNVCTLLLHVSSKKSEECSLISEVVKYS